MEQENGQRRYMAFLVRLWQVDSHRPSIWRASIQDSHTGERRGFAGLEGLFAFLREQTGEIGPGIAPAESDHSS